MDSGAGIAHLENALGQKHIVVAECRSEYLEQQDHINRRGKLPVLG
jgi:hypothetical protein